VYYIYKHGHAPNNPLSEPTYFPPHCEVDIDTHAIRFVKNDEGGFEFAYFGIFDGHGGGEASKFARDHLLDEITKYECFWNDNDDDVLHAIKSGFLDVHFAKLDILFENLSQLRHGGEITMYSKDSI
jgi:serine/threonine protein phosphatase PrpC